MIKTGEIPRITHTPDLVGHMSDFWLEKIQFWKKLDFVNDDHYTRSLIFQMKDVRKYFTKTFEGTELSRGFQKGAKALETRRVKF